MTGEIAGAAVGLGAAEVDERLSVADEVTAGGYTERADALRAEAGVLTALLGDV